MKNFSWYFFDLDGTLTDPAEGIVNSIVYALEKMKLPVPEHSTLLKYIGPPLLESFAKFNGMDETNARSALTLYREYFADRGIFENTLFDGIPELLAELNASGKKVVLATSKPEPYARRILEHFDLTKYFHFIAGSTLDESRVNKDEVIAWALENCGLSHGSPDVVMIGDREHDILGACKNSIASIGVLFGYGSREELEKAGATQIAETVQDLSKLLFI